MSSKTLYASASLRGVDDGLGKEPEGIRVVVDEDFAKQIKEFAAIVKNNGWYRVEKFDYRPEWLSEDPSGSDAPDNIPEADCRLDCVTLSVGDDGFWYEALIKHTDLVIASDRMELSDLP